MSLTTTEKMNEFLRMGAAYLLMFLLFLMSVVSFYTPLSTKIEVPFLVMIIYYWTVYRPTLLPPVLVFMMGACFDLLSGLPLGLSSAVFLIIRHALYDQRIFLTGQPFMVIWLGYIIVSAVALFAQWALFGLIQFHWTPVFPIVLMIVVGILLFPFISLILNGSHKLLPELSRNM